MAATIRKTASKRTTALARARKDLALSPHVPGQLEALGPIAREGNHIRDFAVYARHIQFRTWRGEGINMRWGSLNLRPHQARVACMIGCQEHSFQRWLGRLTGGAADQFKAEAEDTAQVPWVGRNDTQNARLADVMDAYYIGLMTLQLCAMAKWPDADWED